MNIYKVEVMAAAYDDIDRFLGYIRDVLMSDMVADSYAESLEEGLQKLAYLADGKPVLKDIKSQYKNLRRMRVKRCLLFYVIDEKEGVVRVLRMKHSLANWRDNFDA